MQLTFYLFFLSQWKKTCRVELISYRIGCPRCHCSERNLIKSWGRSSRDIWTTSRKRWLIFNRYFYNTLCWGKKFNVMHDLFLIYVTVNCCLYRNFIVLIFQKIVFYYFFISCLFTDWSDEKCPGWVCSRKYSVCSDVGSSPWHEISSKGMIMIF